ncbi:MAG: GyrI-like domain-containing protein [Deltaproteobacteria bacterium]|nr:GyrI-like domain-containing protein [Deltaproteobacteria bacterium]
MKKLLIVPLLVFLVSAHVIASQHDVSLIQLNRERVMIIQANIPDSILGSTMREYYTEIDTFIREYGYEPGPAFARYLGHHDWYTTVQVGFYISEQFPYSGQGYIYSTYLPGGLTATTVHTGPYPYLDQAYAAIEWWMDNYGYYSVSAPWEVYIDDPTIVPESEVRTQIFWPCSPIAP